MAAWAWNSPTRSRVRAAWSTSTRSAIMRVSHRLRSCSASGTRLPSGRGPCRAPRVVDQHEREEARHFLIFGLGRQLAGEPDRLGGEVDVAGVALVEYEVEHAQHRGDVTGLVEPDARDCPLGAADP